MRNSSLITTLALLAVSSLSLQAQAVVTPPKTAAEKREEAAQASRAANAKTTTAKEVAKEIAKAKAEEQVLAENQVKAGDKAIALPKYNVTGKRIIKPGDPSYEAKVKGFEIEKQIAREEKNTKSTEVDDLLNGKKISILGNLSADARAADAQDRITELKVKETVAALAEDPKSEEENKKLVEMLRELEYQKKHR